MSGSFILRAGPLRLQRGLATLPLARALSDKGMPLPQRYRCLPQLEQLEDRNCPNLLCIPGAASSDVSDPDTADVPVASEIAVVNSDVTIENSFLSPADSFNDEDASASSVSGVGAAAENSAETSSASSQMAAANLLDAGDNFTDGLNDADLAATFDWTSAGTSTITDAGASQPSSPSWSGGTGVTAVSSQNGIVFGHESSTQSITPAVMPASPSPSGFNSTPSVAPLGSNGAQNSGAPSSGNESPSATSTPAVDTEAIAREFGNLPLTFEANVGQTDSQVQFLAHGPGYTGFLTETGPVLTLTGSGGVESVVRNELVGSNLSAQAVGRDKLATITNYLIGNKPSDWHLGVANYAQVAYQSVYPGVDMIYHSPGQGQLEYDFAVAPGANPAQIRMAISGAQSLALDSQGNLVIHTGAGDLIQNAPLLSQQVGGATTNVAGHFVLQGNDEVGFAVGAYDLSRTLVIDPTVAWYYSTYLGGNGTDNGKSDPNARLPGLPIAVDGAGNAYVTGNTTSTNFPAPSGGYSYKGPPSNPNQGWQAAFVTEMNAQGTALVYSTYLGGVTGTTYGNAIAIFLNGDGTYNAYITGNTNCTDFPTANVPSDPRVGTSLTPGDNGNYPNVFLTRLNSHGSPAQLTKNDTGFSEYYIDSFGGYYTGDKGVGSGYDITGTLWTLAYEYRWWTGHTANAIAVDSSGNAYLTGGAYGLSVNWAKTGGPKAQQNPFHVDDAFWSKFAPNGVPLYETTLGGEGFVAASGLPDNSAGTSYGTGIALDPAGDVFLTGNTNAYHTGKSPQSVQDFPTALAYQSQVGLDPNKNSVFTPFAATPFAAEFDASLGYALEYCTYFGGVQSFQPPPNNSKEPDNSNAVAVRVDGSGIPYVYLTGQTPSAAFPILNGYQTSLGSAASGAFVSELKFGPSGSTMSLLYSTYLHGIAVNSNVSGQGIVLDGSNNAWITGWVNAWYKSPDPQFPLVNPLQSSFGGGVGPPDDAIISEVNPAASGSASLLFSTYLGGSGNDEGLGIAAEPGTSKFFVTGLTTSGAGGTTNFPTHNPYQSQIGGAQNAFITAVTSS